MQITRASLLLLYSAYYFGARFQYSGYISICAILLIVAIEFYQRPNISNLLIIYVLLSSYYALNMYIINNSVDIGTGMAIISIPIIFDALTKNQLITKNIVLTLSAPSILIFTIFIFYILIEIFPTPGYSFARIPLSTLAQIFTLNSNSSIRDWASTDAIAGILISFPFMLLLVKSNKRIQFLLMLASVLVSLYIFKMVALIATLVFAIVFQIDTKYHKYLVSIVISLLIIYPFIVISDYFVQLITDSYVNYLLSYRGEIWASAINMINHDSSRFLFGIGQREIQIREIFSHDHYYMDISYHSGLLRLLVQNGYVFFLLSFMSIFHLIRKYYRLFRKTT